MAYPPPTSHEAQPESPSPAEMRDPMVRAEFRRAFIWTSVLLGTVLVALLAQPILVIIGGIVVACMLDGGTRLLGRVLPIARGLRLTLVLLAVIAFIGWVGLFAGSEIAEQAAQLPSVIELQIDRISELAARYKFTAGSDDLSTIASQAMSSLGQVTLAVTSVLGGLASLAMICVLGVFVAADPRLYERGFAWMLPMSERGNFYDTLEKIGSTLRRLLAGRLLGMFVEGVGTWALLAIGGVPMAALLGLLTGLLAFLPNIGAIISGILIVSVGFTAGTGTGIYALCVYVGVQAVDSYLIVPMVAKKAVDLAPALVLGAQIIMGALFGILGLALADPIVASIKVALERQSSRIAKADPSLPGGAPSASGLP
ncbi:MAG: AI-2E family transporter [Blastomonas sp.]